MCALADAQIASPIAFERGRSVRRCYGSLSARSLARPGGGACPSVPMVVSSVCFCSNNSGQQLGSG